MGGGRDRALTYRTHIVFRVGLQPSESKSDRSSTSVVIATDCCEAEQDCSGLDSRTGTQLLSDLVMGDFNVEEPGTRASFARIGLFPGMPSHVHVRRSLGCGFLLPILRLNSNTASQPLLSSHLPSCVINKSHSQQTAAAIGAQAVLRESAEAGVCARAHDLCSGCPFRFCIRTVVLQGYSACKFSGFFFLVALDKQPHKFEPAALSLSCKFCIGKKECGMLQLQLLLLLKPRLSRNRRFSSAAGADGKKSGWMIPFERQSTRPTAVQRLMQQYSGLSS